MSVTGQPREWARDMAIVGGVTASLAPLPALTLGATAGFIGGTALAGTLTGAALGAAMPGLLERVRGRLPLSILMVLGPVPGALWGGIVGAVGSVLSGVGTPLTLCVLCAAIAGAIQFGLFWFPYTFQTVRGARRWPVVLAACLATPIIGLLTVLTVLAGVLGPAW
jgi:hypothetical protein